MMCGLKSFSIKQPKKGVVQLSAKKTQLLSSHFTSCHLSTVKMVSCWKSFCDLSQQLTGYQSWDSTKKSKCFWPTRICYLVLRLGLILQLSQNVTKNMLETVLKEGLGFGIIWLGLFIDTIKLYSCTLAIASCQMNFFFVCFSFFLFVLFWRHYFLVRFYHQLSRFGFGRFSSELEFLCRLKQYVPNIENV